ncbi:LPXTG cell wall anchor domain-containing protein [Enterococcus gallinarum]|nr:LPXTG cell wall anchor domain-containing protein [Enterococcus gallinarum]
MPKTGSSDNQVYPLVGIAFIGLVVTFFFRRKKKRTNKLIKLAQ